MEDPSDVRRAMAEAAEARARRQGGKPSAKAKPKPSSTASSGRGGGAGHAGANSSGGNSAARAAAAEQRIQANGNLSAEKLAELDERRAKDDVIGQIRAICAARNMDEPFGLPAASLPALRRRLAKLREQS